MADYIPTTAAVQAIIAEDHPVFRQALADILLDMPEIDSVLQVGNGIQALELIKRHCPAVALVDIRMPGLDGLSLTLELQRQCPNVRVLIISSLGELLYVRKAMESGAHGFMVKDSAAEEICLAIRTLLSGESYLCSKHAQALAWQHLSPVSNPPFSERERQVITLLCQEASTFQIAEQLCMSERTVDRIRSYILQKTGAKSTVGVVLYAARNGLLTEELVVKSN